MRVFLSHASRDVGKVEALATALRERGIDVWLDRWELLSGDDFVARINKALQDAEAGLIVFSAAAAESRWVSAEPSYLIWASVEPEPWKCQASSWPSLVGFRNPPRLLARRTTIRRVP